MSSTIACYPTAVSVSIELREYRIGEEDVFVEVCAVTMGASLDRLVPITLSTSEDSATGECSVCRGDQSDDILTPLFSW